VSSRFIGVREIFPKLTAALVDFEGESLDFNNLVAVHVFDLWRFPTNDASSYSRLVFLDPETLLPTAHTRDLADAEFQVVTHSQLSGVCAKN
jgi:hypothetical protein